MPSQFTKSLIVQKIGDRTWKLYTPFEYHIGEEGSDERIEVPEGFKTDFASVPRAFWWLFPPDGRYTNAAIIHDYLYYTKGFGRYSRKQADLIFLEAMKVLGVPYLQRKTIYRAVRLFGPRW